MTAGRVAFVLLLLGTVSAAQAQSQLKPPPPGTVETIDSDQEIAMIYLREALNSSGDVGRVYYRSACNAKVPTLMGFPSVALHEPQKGKTGLAAVQDIFQGDTKVSVKQLGHGVVQVVIGEMPERFLKTRISLLLFDPTAQYDPGLAILELEKTREVLEFAERDRLYSDVTFWDLVIVDHPNPGSPHLPPSLKNITIDDALTLIATTFRGIVLFGICTEADGTSIYDIGFVPLAEAH